MRINLKCPFSEKDRAKSLGAKWDMASKVWYIEDMEDLTPFMQWIDRPHTQPKRHQAPPACKHERKDRHAPFTTVGKYAPKSFDALPYLPWEDEQLSSDEMESLRVLRSF